MRRGRAFTLVELLIVIGIIALLVSILVPSLQSAVAMVRNRDSQSRMRQIAQAFYQFAGDHQSRLPGCWRGRFTGPETWQKSWLGTELWPGGEAPGTLLGYVGGTGAAEKLYRCPSLDKGVYCSGLGSNGLFDYSMFMCFSGARTGALPTTADVRIAAPPADEILGVATPLVVEEDPVQWLNNGCVDPGHSNTDRMGSYQWGKSGNYAASDGSAHNLRFETVGPTTHEWFGKAPSGQYLALSSYVGDTGWGTWNTN